MLAILHNANKINLLVDRLALTQKARGLAIVRSGYIMVIKSGNVNGPPEDPLSFPLTRWLSLAAGVAYQDEAIINFSTWKHRFKNIYVRRRPIFNTARFCRLGWSVRKFEGSTTFDTIMLAPFVDYRGKTDTVDYIHIGSIVTCCTAEILFLHFACALNQS